VDYTDYIVMADFSGINDRSLFYMTHFIK